jgi:hypothetical protein
MLIRHFAMIAAAAGILFALAPSPALSRMWKVTPEAMARDYVTINDTRPGGELVMLMWFVPQMVPSNSVSNAGQDMLKKYVVIAVVHGQMDLAAGALSFRDIDRLEARDQGGRALTAIAGDDLPPTNIGMLRALEGVFRQSLGALGKGMKMFVFDGQGMDSCKQGRLSVPFANETYTWDTPIPGCRPS